MGDHTRCLFSLSSLAAPTHHLTFYPLIGKWTRKASEILELASLFSSPLGTYLLPQVPKGSC